MRVNSPERLIKMTTNSTKTGTMYPVMVELTGCRMEDVKEIAALAQLELSDVVGADGVDEADPVESVICDWCWGDCVCVKTF